ncbi:MAG: fibronectin type III domain-containing protein [Bacteroidota bacterium]
MKKALFFLAGFYCYVNSFAQVTCTATGSSGSGYAAITGAAFGIESPDCEHTSFGAHVTQTFDNDLDRNVFIFHSHVDDDNDRCQVFDRVRMEIKGGPNTAAELQHTENATSYYRWKFRIAENFVGASSFNHIFQNKAKGGNDDAFPVLTITLRANVLEVRHNGGDTGNDLGVVAEADLDLFRGRWVEAFFKQTHSENGALEISLKDMATGLTLLAYSNADIDLWRTGADYNRPKWGMYRLKNSALQDETIRFADFCISELDSALCPAEAVLIPDTVAPTAPTNLTVTDVSVNSVDLNWEAATDFFGVTAYDVLRDGNVIQITSDTFLTINNLTPATTYTFAVQAKDAAGNISQQSNSVVVTTDATTVLPDAATSPFPTDGATAVSNYVVLSWEEGSNTDSVQVFFGTNNNPSLVAVTTDNFFQPALNPFTTYFWKIVAVNDNGMTSSPTWTFTTGDSNPDFPWQVYRAHARPEVETNFFELNEAPVMPPVDEIVDDPNGSPNTFYGFRSNNSEKFRWRNEWSPTDSVVTVVARLRGVDAAVNGICYFEIRGNGWRQKIRINQSTIKLEKTTPAVEVDLPFDWVTEMHLIRIVSDGQLTSVYLDENPIPFASGVSDTPSSNHYFEWGNSGGVDYGAYVDWLAMDKSEGYAPDGGTPLPTDLFLSSVATLASLEVDGNALTGFAPDVFTYTVELSNNTIPTLTWTTTSDLATANNNNPTSVPNSQATIEVTAQDGFTTQVYTLNYVGPTSLENQFSENEIRIFPNPTQRHLQVFLGKNQKGIAQIFSATGQHLANDLLILGNKTIEIAYLPTGIYFITIQMQDGEIATKRFTVTK